MRCAAVIASIGLCLMASSAVEATVTLTNEGMISLTAPAGFVGSAGGGIAFIPANTDSITEDTLVINWRTTVGAQNTHIFERITIPTGGGAPQVLATATLSTTVGFTGGTVGASNMQDLVFDPVNNKLVTIMSNQRFLSLGLFAANTTLTSTDIGYSKYVNSSANFGRAITLTPDGRYQTFYNTASGWQKFSIARGDMNGTVAITQHPAIATSSFTNGWYPNANGSPTTVNGNDCEGAVAYGDDQVLMLRNFNNGTTAETHIYTVGSAMDVAAINGHADLGNATSLNSAANSYYGWGLTANPAAGVAFIRYGYLNEASKYPRILMVGGLPVVPEPATLALVLGGCALMAARRRRA